MYFKDNRSQHPHYGGLQFSVTAAVLHVCSAVLWGLCAVVICKGSDEKIQQLAAMVSARNIYKQAVTWEALCGSTCASLIAVMTAYAFLLRDVYTKQKAASAVAAAMRPLARGSGTEEKGVAAALMNTATNASHANPIVHRSPYSFMKQLRSSCLGICIWRRV